MDEVDEPSILHNGNLLDRVPDFELFAQAVDVVIGGFLPGGAEHLHVEVRAPAERHHLVAGLLIVLRILGHVLKSR